MIGIDIVEIENINVDKLYNIFTEEEKKYIDSSSHTARRQEIMAGLYAGKEAVFKALKFDNLGLEILKRIEIKHKPNGQPYVCIDNNEQDIELSISHTKHNAVAVAIKLNNN